MSASVATEHGEQRQQEQRQQEQRQQHMSNFPFNAPDPVAQSATASTTSMEHPSRTSSAGDAHRRPPPPGPPPGGHHYDGPQYSSAYPGAYPPYHDFAGRPSGGSTGNGDRSRDGSGIGMGYPPPQGFAPQPPSRGSNSTGSGAGTNNGRDGDESQSNRNASSASVGPAPGYPGSPPHHQTPPYGYGYPPGQRPPCGYGGDHGMYQQSPTAKGDMMFRRDSDSSGVPGISSRGGMPDGRMYHHLPHHYPHSHPLSPSKSSSGSSPIKRSPSSESGSPSNKGVGGPGADMDIERLRAAAATELSNIKVKPIRTDFHFFVDDHKDLALRQAQIQVRATHPVPENSKEERYLINTNVNTRLMLMWERLSMEKREIYMGKEEQDRRRFMEEDEIASRHCATLTARGKSPRTEARQDEKEATPTNTPDREAPARKRTSQRMTRSQTSPAKRNRGSSSAVV